MALPESMENGRDGQEAPSPWESLTGEIRSELEQSKKQLEEITLLIDQSQVEVNKLAQRNASITGRLQQVQSQFDSMPRDEIRSSYDSALEAQQRLFVMRGQLEKLENDRLYLEKYPGILERILQLVPEGGPGQEVKPRSSYGMVEMMIQAQESERLRLSRQMHDGPAQALSNFILQTEIAMRLFEVNPDQAREELGNLKTAATTTFQQVREFIFALRPMMLDDLGFLPTVKRYVEALNEQASQDITVRVTGAERRLESYLEVMIFRALQELINNALLHSQATEIKVQIDIAGNDVRTVVDDNGRGFDPGALEEDTGVGLSLIRERVEMLGGRFEVDSVEGQGTRIIMHVPAA